MYATNKIETFRPAYRREHRPSRVCSIFCLLIASLFYLTAATKTATAATYYLDAVNGNDSNPGSSTQPWKTLAKAQSVVVEGDIVILSSGNYGAFTDTTNRTDWLIWRADTGHAPEFSYITIGNYGNQGNDAYLEFDGIVINGGNASSRAVSPYVVNHVRIKNCTFTGQGYTENDASAGVYLYHCNDVNISNCIIMESSDVVEGGYEWGVYGRYSHDIIVQDCDISGSAAAVKAWGKRWTIANNTLHNLDSDGILLECVRDTTVSNNTIYSIYAPIYFTYDGGCSYDDTNGVITADAGSPFGVIKAAQPIRITPDGEAASDWYVVDTSTASTITLTELIGDGDYASVTLVEVKKGYHCDGIQTYKPNVGEAELFTMENLTFSRNKIYDVEHQGLFAAFTNATGVSDITYENNLVYDIGGSDVDLHNQANVVFRGNTVPNGFCLFRATCSNTIITGNIIYQASIYETEDVNTEDYNILWQWWGPHDDDHVAGTNDTVYGSGDEAGFKALFADYDTNDFSLATDSLAIDFGNADYAPVSDILGVSRVFPPDAGCYEYIPADANNQPPVLQAIGNKSVNENSLLTFDVNATDPDGDSITYSAQNLPSGATFSGQNFNWTPSYTQADTYQVTFTASDGQAQDSETITITVSNTNRAPVLEAIGDKSVNENSILSFPISATDADGDTITYSVENLPSGATFGSQTLTWTPGYNQEGAYQVTFTASDGSAQDSETITVTVNNVNRAPVLSIIGNKSVYADSLLTFSVNATDPDSDEITYSADGLPSGATFTSQSFNWTPGQSQRGSYEVTFTASDSQLGDSETITITVDSDTSAPGVTNCLPAADSIQAATNTLVILHIADTGKGVDANSVTIKVNSNTVYTGNATDYSSEYGRCRRTGTKADYTFVYQPNETLNFDQTVTVTVNATDLAGNAMDEYSYSFKTEMRSFGTNKKVNSGSDNLSKAGPVTVRDSSGNIWVTWHAGPAGSRDIYVGKLAAGADNFGSSTLLTNNAADQCNPAIALGADDKLYVAWQDNRRGDWDIYVSDSSDGISWSAAERVADSNDNQTNPAIVVDGLSPNCAHIVWQDDRAGNQDIYIATSSDGFITETVSQITSDGSDQTEPAIAVDTDNTVYVVWTDARASSSDIYAAASDNGWTNVAIVNNTNDQSSPAIATESTGSILHLLWVDDSAGNKDIYYAYSNGLPGSTLNGSSIIDDDSGRDQLAPVIITTGSTAADLKVFACWQDRRNITGNATDTDLYFAEISSDSKTNVFVGDDSTNANQSEPAIGIDGYGHPYLVWTDDRNVNAEIYYAGSTFAEPDALASENVSVSSGKTVGTEPAVISGADDVSIIVPVAAYSCDIKITISRVKNPQKLTLQRFSLPYEFSPSGINFDQPVTITIPYEVSSSGNLASAYWYNPLTGTLSQHGITDVEDIVISPSLHALRFKTTHFTQFLVGGGIAAAAAGGGGGGGCSISPNSQGNIVEFSLPYLGLTVVMIILKLRDARNRKARTIAKGKC